MSAEVTEKGWAVVAQEEGGVQWGEHGSPLPWPSESWPVHVDVSTDQLTHPARLSGNPYSSEGPSLGCMNGYASENHVFSFYTTLIG